jgi:hypothetical protein
MATSGSTTFEMTRDQIIAAAMRKAQSLAKGQSPDSTDLSDFTYALNALVASFQTLGMPLWARKEYSLTFIAGQKTYVFGDGEAVDIPFPLKIQQAALIATSGSGVVDMEIMSLYDYNLLPATTSGMPVNVCYTPAINVGTLQVWPTPDSNAVSDYTLKLTYQRPFDDFVSAGDTPYFPKEWHNALIYGLASDIADELALPQEDCTKLERKASKYLDMALSFGVEDTSLIIQPKYQ